MVRDMRHLLPLIDNLIVCPGGNQSDYTGIRSLWKDSNDKVVGYLTGLAETARPTNLWIKNLIQQLNNVTIIAVDVFKSCNDLTLPECWKTSQWKNPANMVFDANSTFTVFADMRLTLSDRLHDPHNVAGTAIGKVLEFLFRVIKMFGLIPTTDPDSPGEPQTGDILTYLGVNDSDGDCGDKVKCMGAIEIVKVLLKGIFVDVISHIPPG
ncbi:hypothetical protein BGZ96_011354, partial [Linnemannia gamsii]